MVDDREAMKLSQEVLANIQELVKSIEENAYEVERRITSSGRTPDAAIVMSASKYYSALERLAQE